MNFEPAFHIVSHIVMVGYVWWSCRKIERLKSERSDTDSCDLNHYRAIVNSGAYSINDLRSSMNMPTI